MTLLLGAIWTALRFLPFRFVQRMLARFATPTPEIPVRDAAYMGRVVWAAERIARRMLRDRPCLTQALAVQLLMKRSGYPAELRLGVARSETGALLAHAWVESAGKVVIGGTSSPSTYTPLLPGCVSR